MGVANRSVVSLFGGINYVTITPLLHISLGFNFNPLFIYSLDIIIQFSLPLILISQHYDQAFLIF
jgi:hypothetical protein